MVLIIWSFNGHCIGKFGTSLQQYILMVLVFKGLVIRILMFESGFDHILIFVGCNKPQVSQQYVLDVMLKHWDGLCVCGYDVSCI